MTLHEKLKESLKTEEGLKLTVYKCPTGHATIGYGHNLETSPLPISIAYCFVQHKCITQDQAEKLLDMDVEKAISDSYRIIPNWNVLSLNRQFVVADMVYNMGASKFLNFIKFRSAISRKEWKQAADEMLNSKWAKQAPNRAKELHKIFLEG